MSGEICVVGHVVNHRALLESSAVIVDCRRVLLRTDVKNLGGIRVENYVKVQGVGVEMLVLAQSGIDERSLQSSSRSESLVVPDTPAVGYDLMSFDSCEQKFIVRGVSPRA